MTNFRKNLIAKCIVDDGTVEADNDSLQELLQSNLEGDQTKLMNYAWRHVIPQAQRVPLYKQLLGISGCYPETRAVVAKHREDEAKVLLRSLRTMRTFEGTVSDEGEPKPTICDIVKMILLSRGQLSQTVMVARSDLSSAKEPGVREIFAITTQVNQLCPENWVDVFFIARRIFELVDKILDQQTMQSTIQQIRHKVNTSKEELPEKLEWRKIDLQLWLRSCMCAVITCDRTSFKIFDKVVTGQCVVPLLRSMAINFVTQRTKGPMNPSLQQRCATQAIETTWLELKGGGGASRGQWSRRPWTVDVEEGEARPISWQRKTVS